MPTRITNPPHANRGHSIARNRPTGVPHDRHRFGHPDWAACLAIVILLVALVIAIGCGENGSAVDRADAGSKPGSNTGVNPGANAGAGTLSVEEADERLAALEEQTQAAIRNHRDLTPFIDTGRELLAVHPHPGEVHRLLGLATQTMGRPDEAMSHFQAALREQPDNAELRLYAATLAETLGHSAEAEAGYRRVLALDPDHHKARIMLANLLLKADRLDEARAQAGEAVNRDSSMHQPYALLAHVAAAKGDLARAASLMGRAAEHVPELDLHRDHDPNADFVLTYRLAQGRWLREQGDPEAALAAVAALPATLRVRPEALELAAACHDDLGRPLDAARQYEQVLTVVREDGDLAAHAAYWYAKAGQPDKARPYLQLATSLGGSTAILNQARATLRGEGPEDSDQ